MVHLFISEELTYEELRVSHLASNRLRVFQAVDGLRGEGVDITWGPRIPAGIDKLILGKIYSNPSLILHVRNAINSRQVTSDSVVVVDYTDNAIAQGYGKPDRMNLYRHLVLDQKFPLVFADSSMEKTLESSFDVKSQVLAIIPDAYEFNVLPPVTKRQKRIMWFGHPSNVGSLITFLKSSWVAQLSDYELVIVSDRRAFEAVVKTSYSKPPTLSLRFVEWSLKVMPLVANECSICLITGNKEGASINRLVTALGLGIPVISDVLPSYAPAKEWFVPLSDEQMVRDALSNPDEFFDQVNSAQTQFLPDYLPKSVQAKWLRLIMDCD